MYPKEVLFVKIGFFEKFPQYVIDEKQKKLELENFKEASKKFSEKDR